MSKKSNKITNIDKRRTFNVHGFCESDEKIDDIVRNLRDFSRGLGAIIGVGFERERSLFDFLDVPIRKLHDQLGWSGKFRTDGGGFKTFYREAGTQTAIQLAIKNRKFDQTDLPLHQEHTVPIAQLRTLIHQNRHRTSEELLCVVLKYSIVAAVPGTTFALSSGQTARYNPHYQTKPLSRYANFVIVNGYTGEVIDVESWTVDNHVNLLFLIPFYKTIFCKLGISHAQLRAA